MGLSLTLLTVPVQFRLPVFLNIHPVCKKEKALFPTLLYLV